MNIRKYLMPTLFVAALTLVFATPANAQDATPDDIFGAPSGGYPVALHEGSCEDPTAEPAFQLQDNALAIGVDQDEPNVVRVAETRPITETSGALDVSFDDLVGTEHVVAIHASPDEFGTLVACGAIAGVEVDGKLVVALVPVGDSGVSGVAIFDRDDSGFLDLGDDQTQLTVYVITPDKGDDATPTA